MIGDLLHSLWGQIKPGVSCSLRVPHAPALINLHHVSRRSILAYVGLDCISQLEEPVATCLELPKLGECACKPSAHQPVPSQLHGLDSSCSPCAQPWRAGWCSSRA